MLRGAIGLASHSSIRRADTRADRAALETTPGVSPSQPTAIPERQQQLCALVTSFAQRYKAEPRRNELRRSQIRAARTRALIESTPQVEGWVGTLVNVTTNGDGKGVVSVKLTCDEDIDISVHTWTMSLADITDETLLSPSSNAFAALAELHPGQRVIFSGSFVTADDVNGWRETSLTERGSMTAPELVFRFSSVEHDPNR